MNVFLQELARQFPTLIVIFAIAGLAWLGVREYRKARSETEAEIEKQINARIGESISLIQEKIIGIDMLITDRVRKIEAADKRFQEFSELMSGKEQDYLKVYEEATEQLGKLRDTIPDVEKESAYEILERSRGDVEGHTAAALLEKLLDHQDATSQDLELAGDRAVEVKRRSLALRLYERAHEKDPDNLSAHFELLKLRALDLYEMREQALREAEELMFNNISEVSVRLLADALHGCNRYEAAARVFERVIAETSEQERDVRVLAFRNLAVSKRNLRQYEESEEAFEAAFEISPDDENVLRPYLNLLEEKGKDDEYIKISKRLIEIDPSDVSYYTRLANFYSGRGQYKEALELIDRVRPLNPTGIHARVLAKIILRANAAGFTMGAEEAA